MIARSLLAAALAPVVSMPAVAAGQEATDSVQTCESLAEPVKAALDSARSANGAYRVWSKDRVRRQGRIERLLKAGDLSAATDSFTVLAEPFHGLVAASRDRLSRLADLAITMLGLGCTDDVSRKDVPTFMLDAEEGL